MTRRPACRVGGARPSVRAGAGRRAAGSALAAALAAATGACQQHPPPAAPPVVLAPAPVPPEPRHEPARRVVVLGWSFDFAPDQCVATAAGDLATLTVTARRNATVDVHLAVSGPQAGRITAHSSASLRFSGPSGHWSLPASGTAQHTIGAASGPDELALGRALILLGGGTLDVALPQPGLPAVEIPPAGPQGQAWSDCARRQMI